MNSKCGKMQLILKYTMKMNKRIISEESKIIKNDEEINLIMEPFIIITDEPKVNKLIIKNYENINEINFIDFNEICINNQENTNEINLTNLNEIYVNNQIK